MSLVLWCDLARPAAENMRRDAGLLEAAERGAPAVLRLFRFEPHGITLGHAQRPERELDLARCEAAGIGWAVRPTGGRAIFHAEEWTYALAAPLADPEWGGGLHEAYARVSRLVLRSLLRLGVPAEFSPGESGAGRAERGVAAPPCFASTARHELTLHGRKLVGSAQRRTARALLQQGSLLLGPGHLRLAEFVAAPEGRRARMRAALEASSAHAGAFLGAATPLERWADALAAEVEGSVRRFDGDAGAFLLTPFENGSYTRPASSAPA